MSELYKVKRNCCTSGNCGRCRGETPFGVPMRIIHDADMSKARAELVARNWSAYKPEIILQPEDVINLDSA